MAKKKTLRAYARKETQAMAPIVRRALAKHGKAGEKVYVVIDGTAGRWVQVSQRGSIKETATKPYAAAKKVLRTKKN